MTNKEILNTITIVTDVASYISAISDFVKEKTKEKKVYVYRGEARYRQDFCTPNIFRKNVLNDNDYYEKSLFNAMRQSRLTAKESYLENAIDAQHGEFPSRLLDVSYNCLNALYFAVTPYYRKNIKQYDDRDGMVYVFSIDEIYSPSAENIKDCYNAIINKDRRWFTGQSIFSKNHKFIDHARLNNRIIAQQGAFILFQGDDAEKLPAYMVKGFNIPASAKARIREELSIMFGINTGAIYPEIYNLVEEITEKSKNLITEKFCWQNEMNNVLRNFQKELDFYLSEICLKNKDSNEFCDLMYCVEEMINSYRVGLLKFYNDFEKFNLDNDSKNEMIDKIKEYNKKVGIFRKELGIVCGNKAGISTSLTIGEDCDVDK